MKLNGKALVAVVARFGSMAAVGCKKSGDAASEAAPAPVTLQADTANADAPAASDERTTVTVAAGTRAAPPALRVERPGRAPSAHHVWQRGYCRYDSPRAASVAPLAPFCWPASACFCCHCACIFSPKAWIASVVM